MFSLHPVILLNSLISSWDFPHRLIMSSSYRDSFISSFQFYMYTFYFLNTGFSFHIMLNKSGENGHPCLGPQSGDSIQSSTLSILLPVGVYSYLFPSWENSPLFLFFGDFLYEWVLNFIKYFFCINWHNHMIFLFSLLGGGR